MAVCYHREPANPLGTVSIGVCGARRATVGLAERCMAQGCEALSAFPARLGRLLAARTATMSNYGLTDVPDVRVGHSTDRQVATGCLWLSGRRTP